MTQGLERLLFSVVWLSACAVPLFFLRYTKDCFLLPKQTLLLLLSCAGLVALLCAAWRRSLALWGAFVRPPWLFLALGALWTAGAAPFSVNPALTVQSLAHGAGLLVLLVAAAVSARGTERLRLLACGLAASGSLASLYALVQYLGWDFLVWDTDPADLRIKAVSTFGNPQLLAGWLAAVLPVTLCCLLDAARSPGLSRRGLRLGLLSLSFALQTGGLYVGHSRMAAFWATAGCLAVLGLFFFRRTRRAPVVLGLLLIFGLGLFAVRAVSVDEKTPSVFSETVQGRVFMWKMTSELIALSPWTGMGPGTFPYVYPGIVAAFFKSQPDPEILPDFLARRREWAHNDPLQSACESGFPAALFFVLFVLSTLHRFFRSRIVPENARVFPDPLALGFFAALGVLSLLSLTQFVVYTPATAALFAVCGGLLAGAVAVRPPRLLPGGRLLPLGLAACELFIFCGLLLFGQFALRPFLGDLFTRQGHTFLARGDNTAAFDSFSRALAFYPSGGQARFGLGLALLNGGKNQEAFDQFMTAADTLQAEGVFHAAGNALLALGQPERAAVLFEQALAVNPFFGDSRVNLAIALTLAGRHGEAVKHFEIAAGENYPLHIRVGALTDLGGLYYKTGNFPQAVESWKKALELGPASADLRRRLEEKIAKTQEEKL